MHERVASIDHHWHWSSGKQGHAGTKAYHAGIGRVRPRPERRGWSTHMADIGSGSAPGAPYGGRGAPALSERALGVPAAAVAMVGWAASGVIAKGISELGPLAVVFWRMWLYTGLVALFLWANRTPLRLSSIKVSFWGGFSLAFDIMLFFIALRMTTVANATVVASLQPLLMLFLAPRIFGEQPGRRHWGLALVAIGGIAIVVLGSSGLTEWSVFGDLLAFGALLAWTGYFVFSKLSTQKIAAAQYTGGSALVCSLVATPFALASGQVFHWPSSGAWLWLGIMAIGPGVASHMLMNWSLVRIPSWLGSTMTLAIPVTSTLMAWVFLGDQVSLWQFVGMAVVMFALAAVVLDQSRTKL